MLEGPSTNSLLVRHTDTPSRFLPLKSSYTHLNIQDSSFPLHSLATTHVARMVSSQHLSQQGPGRTTSFSTGRPSSRRALTAALELAQEAVRLDTTNDDPIGAISAYSRSVALLNEVMERVMRGEDASDASKDRRRSGRPRSTIAKEEEVRRLRSIHDTYADRMNILSDIYNVDPLNPTMPRNQHTQPDSEQSHLDFDLPEETSDPDLDGNELIGSAMLEPSRESTSTPDSGKTGSDNTYTTDTSLPEFEMVHPPSSQLSTGTIASVSPSASVSSPRVSTLPPPRPPPLGPLPIRPRTGSLSILPPQAPPPRTAPPLPPTNLTESSNLPLPLVSSTARTRGNSTGARQGGSDNNKLDALREEDHITASSQNQPSDVIFCHVDHSYHSQLIGSQEDNCTDLPSQYIATSQPLPPMPPSKDSQPLPSIPSSPMPQFSANSSPSTPRGSSFITPHPFSAQDTTSQPPKRGITIATSHGQTSSTPINSSTAAGAISQRRSKSSTGTVSSLTSSRSSPTDVSQPMIPVASQTPPILRLTASTLPANTANSLGIGRTRSSSQPPRPLLSSNTLSEFGARTSSQSGQAINSQAAIPRKASFPSRLNPSIQSSAQTPAASAFYPSSPFPSPPPTDPLRKPYHLMSLLWCTMTSKTGGYITRRLHVPHEVWSQGGAKLLNLPEKVRVLEVLSGALEELQIANNELTSGIPIDSANAAGRNEVERWLSKLDEWNGVCEGIVANIGRKLGVGEGFGSKRGGVTSWSGKFARSFDRMTNGRNLDSPANYVACLIKVFVQAQILDDHTKALLGTPAGPLYASLSIDMRQLFEIRLKRSSEFFASVVLTFVIRDLAQLLDKYVKKGEKWLAE